MAVPELVKVTRTNKGYDVSTILIVRPGGVAIYETMTFRGGSGRDHASRIDESYRDAMKSHAELVARFSL